MTFELMSQKINTAQLELDQINTEGSARAANEFLAYLGGATVQEFDEQIQVYTAELTAANAEKAAVRADKTQITELMAGSQEITSSTGGTGYVMGTDSEGQPIYYTGEAVVMTQASAQDLINQAATLGVPIDISKLPVGTGTDVAIDIKYFESIEEALDNKLQDLNSTSEMKSIQFQSLMDSRKQAMLMLSNLISSDNETKMSIIANMKG